MSQIDVIDAILGEERTEHVRELREVKPELARQMQDYYDALFRPSSDSDAAFPLPARFLVAIRTSSHTDSSRVTSWYASQATEVGVSSAEVQLAMNAGSAWPEDHPLGPAMRHVDLIVDRPLESSRGDIDALLEFGLSPQGIVVLSQVVAYVSCQVRLIAALRALGAS